MFCCYNCVPAVSYKVFNCSCSRGHISICDLQKTSKTQSFDLFAALNILMASNDVAVIIRIANLSSLKQFILMA